MTDHKDLIERAKAALDWSDTDGLRLLAPDLARALIETTERLERVEMAGRALIATASDTGCVDQREADKLNAALTAFRKAMEDDQ